MPLHFGKLFGAIVVLTIGAFVLWLLWIAFFAGETVEQPEPAALNSSTPALALAALAD